MPETQLWSIEFACDILRHLGERASCIDMLHSRGLAPMGADINAETAAQLLETAVSCVQLMPSQLPLLDINAIWADKPYGLTSQEANSGALGHLFKVCCGGCLPKPKPKVPPTKFQQTIHNGAASTRLDAL